MTPKSPTTTTTQPVRRSSRASTPTNRATSPRLATSTSTPSISQLVPPSTAPASAVRKSASARALSPKPTTPSTRGGGRPPLPKDHGNQQMQDSKAKVHKVKLQVLHLGKDGDTITIARVKCPVPKGVPGHIIKRFDTNAVSASSLFRAAFPTSSPEAEQAEMNWLAKKGKFGDTQLAGVEDDPERKLTGTWIPAANAAELALEYGVLRYAEELIKHQEEAPAVAAVVETELLMADSENDSPAIRSPRTKRQRVLSPSLKSPTRSSAPAAAATPVSHSILQTLSSVANEVEQEVVDREQVVRGEIEQAKELVESLKKKGKEAVVSAAGGSKKRALEDDEEEREEDEEDEQKPGFFGRLMGRKPRSKGTGRAVARRRSAAKAEQEVGQQVLLVERQEVEGRRWVAGFGLALAVGATAAAPYLFG